MVKKYEGIIPPIVTPFDEAGEINESCLRREMELCMEAGAHGLSVGGSTGEGPTLHDDELCRMLEIGREFVGPEQTLVGGVMRMSTRDAVATGLRAREAGADAIMVTPTAYNVLVPNAEGMKGVECAADRVFSMQYHPESASGPQDSGYLFKKFTKIMEERKNA